jgi:hypothetical protein
LPTKPAKKEASFSHQAIGILYIIASFLVVLAFRCLFPVQPLPLQVFALPWRLTQGLLDFINLFPALALSALVIPFGIKKNSGEEDFPRFSPAFLERLMGPIIAAIGAVVLYGLLFFVAYPLAQESVSAMDFKSRMFRDSAERAKGLAGEKAWAEAAQLIAVCERIWPESPEIAALRTTVAISLAESRIVQREDTAGGFYEQSSSPNTAQSSAVPTQREPLDAPEALQFAETALREERYYDAHWLATLAGRLAPPGSVELTAAARMASQAWNAITSLEPNARELVTHDLYRLKQSGYAAMLSEDWIQAYYIFKELILQTPADPDAINFLAKSEENIAGIAFFTDELGRVVGDAFTDVVFSLPRKSAQGLPDGRVVLRIGSLSAFSDVSYGMDVELIAFDRMDQRAYQLTAPYVKILPRTLGDGDRVVFLMHALDRTDQSQSWEPEWTGAGRSELGDTQVILDIGYENFLFLSNLRYGVDDFLLGDLFTLEKGLEDYGYIPQVFRAEILRRIGEPALFLPAVILALIIGWRYRAKERPRYTGIPMLVILPLVFSGLVQLGRGIFNILSIWMVLNFSFTTTLIVLGVGTLVLFIIMLIGLAGQRG